MAFDNEESIELQNESDYRKHQRTVAFGGYTTNKTRFFKTKEYQSLIIEFVKNNYPMTYNSCLPYRKIKLIKEDANKIILSETEGINTLVPFIKNESKLIYNFIAKYSDITDENIEDYIRYIKNKTKYIDITKVPIKWKHKSYKNGQIIRIDSPTNNLETLKKFPYVVTNIQITNQSDKTTSATIVHEQTHILLDRTKGIVENTLHDETLSIYMELLSAYKLDDTGYLLDIMTLQRLLFLKGNILQSYIDEYNGFRFSEETPYIDSSLYAFALIENYLKSNNKSRKSIRKEINKTLNGERTLESTLSKLDITEEEGSHIIKNKIRKLMMK